MKYALRPARPAERTARGADMEALAGRWLTEHGYRIEATNYRLRMGEVDIVAYHGETLCFIEVRSVLSERFGSPLSTISRAKQRRLVRAARYFLMEKGIHDVPMRFDALGIVLEPLSFTLVPNAFQAD